MSGKHLHQNIHHFLFCCQMHDYNFVESTLVVHQYKNTSSCGKRTHRIYGYALPRSSRWLCSRHWLWHLKLANTEHPWHDLQTLRPPAFVLWHALIITMPWCPSWGRRKTFPSRTSRITFLESQKTSLPNKHSSSLTHKHAGVLQRDQSTLRTCCLWLATFEPLSETNSTCLDIRKTSMLSRAVILKKSTATLLVSRSNLIES